MARLFSPSNPYDLMVEKGVKITWIRWLTKKRVYLLPSEILTVDMAYKKGYIPGAI
jgi:hypothetical protein